MFEHQYGTSGQSQFVGGAEADGAAARNNDVVNDNYLSAATEVTLAVNDFWGARSG